MLVLLFGTHLYFTVRLGFIQKKIPAGIRLSVGSGKKSAYSALATALAATIGTGNIIGISTAVAIGGPGAVFWCWITGFFGIATCYAECFLAVRYKVKAKDGRVYGGPMYVLEHGLGKKGMAVMFSLFTVIASLGIGSSVQSHAIRGAVEEQMAVSPHLIGIAAGVMAGLVIIGGSDKIASVCTWLVPVMSVLYLGGCIGVIVQNYSTLPETIVVILRSAFSSKAVAGGLLGRSVMTGIRTGISRGLFTNEAGLGSVPMAAAASGEENPARQALISMTGPFWDTVVMCAITGIAVVSSMLKQPGLYENVAADGLCFVAFRQLALGGDRMLSVSLVLFAFATIIGWNVYGVTAARYLWGERGVAVYQVVYMLFVYLGAVMSLDLVWGFSDLFNSFMAIPNLLCLWMLRDQIRKSTKTDTLLTKN